MSKAAKPGSEDRFAVLKVLKDRRFPNSHFFTKDYIEDRTGLDIRRIMDVTGHDPYDIIGTRDGYKHVSRATRDEVKDAISYNRGKIGAMRQRVAAFEARL